MNANPLFDLINTADQKYHAALTYIKQEGAGSRSKAKITAIDEVLLSIKVMEYFSSEHNHFFNDLLPSSLQKRFHFLIELREVLVLLRAELNEN